MTNKLFSWRYGIALVLALTAGGVGYYLLSKTIFNFGSAEFDHFIAGFGWTGPLVMIGLIVIEVVIAPLPGGWLAIATGYLFGSWPGFIYAYIGNVLGSLIAFALARYFGQRFVQKIVSLENYERYSHKLSRSSLGIGLLYAIPLFPIDVISMLLGVSGITRRRFLTIMLLGFIPNMAIMNFVGGAIGQPEYRYIMIGLVSGVIVYFVWHTASLKINSKSPDYPADKTR